MATNFTHMQTTSFKKIYSTVDIFEEEFSSFLESQDISANQDLVHNNGFNEKLLIYTNNLHQLQQRFKQELIDKEAIKKEVPFVDCAMFLFPSKKINYRYWKAHLKKVGSLIHHCNLQITPMELKNVLLKVFNRNVLVPSGVEINYWRLGVELDEVVEAAIMNVVPERLIKNKKKILFNPGMNLTGKERKVITAKMARL